VADSHGKHVIKEIGLSMPSTELPLEMFSIEFLVVETPPFRRPSVQVGDLDVATDSNMNVDFDLTRRSTAEVQSVLTDFFCVNASPLHQLPQPSYACTCVNEASRLADRITGADLALSVA